MVQPFPQNTVLVPYVLMLTTLWRSERITELVAFRRVAHWAKSDDDAVDDEDDVCEVSDDWMRQQIPNKNQMKCNMLMDFIFMCRLSLSLHTSPTRPLRLPFTSPMQIQYRLLGTNLRHSDARHAGVLHFNGKRAMGQPINWWAYTTSNGIG